MEVRILMYVRRVLSWALILALAGCGSDTVDPNVPETGEINGTVVTTDGAGVSGATLTLSGLVNRTATTGASGEYGFQGLALGHYTVTITPPTGYALALGRPLDRAVQLTGAAARVDFELEESQDPQDPPDTDAPVEVELRNMAFSASTVTIKAGQRVKWINREAVFHTVTPDGHSEWSAASFNQVGDTFEHTFQTPGTYKYYCEPHKSAGMTGTVVVE